MAQIGMRLRVDPYPSKSIDSSLLAELLDFVVAFEMGNVRKCHVFPLLKISLFFIPGVGKNGVRRDLVLGQEISHLPTMRAEKSHVCRLTRQNDVVKSLNSWIRISWDVAQLIVWRYRKHQEESKIA